MTEFLEDVRFAIRAFFKRPGFTSIAVTSLGLGIAVNATVFSWMQSIVLNPVSGVRAGQQLVAIKTVAPDGSMIDSSYPDYQDFAAASRTLSGIVAFRLRPLYIGEAPHLERVWSEMVSPNFFDTLGVAPLVGRTFSVAQATPRALISESLWHRRFQSTRGIVGKNIRLNQQTVTVVGVIPNSFRGTYPGLTFDVWVPLSMQAQLTGSWNWLADRDARPLVMMGRLCPGISIEVARAEIIGIAQRLARTHSEDRRLSARVMPVGDSPDGVQRVLGRLVRVLLVIAAAVLLIVCANVSNLLLTRTLARQKEFGIRLSLGASRSRLARQLFTEVLVLAAAGTVVGLMAAPWLSRGIELFVPPTELPIGHLSGAFQGADYLAAFGLCIGAALLCVLAPVVQLARGDLRDSLHSVSRSASANRRSRNLHGSLVIVELSLAIIALIGTGLFIRSFENARNADPGFDPQNVLTVGLDLSQAHMSRSDATGLLKRLEHELAVMPGVRSVGLCEDIPLGFSGGSWETIGVNGYAPRPGENMEIWRNLVSPGYLGTMKIPLVAGRDFTDRDTRDSAPVAIVNQTFIRRFLPAGNALGAKLHTWGKEITIIGIARDAKYRQITEPPLPYFYLPVAQFYTPDRAIALELRTSGASEAFVPAIRSAIRNIDPNLPIVGTTPLLSYMSASWFAQKVGANLLSILGALALLLAALGLYGVMAYAIGERTCEIGIRMALGARPGQVLSRVLQEGLRLCAIGIAIGVSLSIFLARIAAGALYRISSSDLLTYVLAVCVLLAFGIAATWLPARRAARINPIEALHWE